MPGVLAMTAFEVGYPMTLFVLMEADNALVVHVREGLGLTVVKRPPG
jgi:hypothetical protein